MLLHAIKATLPKKQHIKNQNTSRLFCVVSLWLAVTMPIVILWQPIHQGSSKKPDVFLNNLG